jgi:hypothetical protein
MDWGNAAVEGYHRSLLLELLALHADDLGGVEQLREV